MKTVSQLPILLLVICCINVFAQKNTVVYNGIKECEYETKQGRIEGKYVSWFPNGRKKAEGMFQSNYPIGKWVVWDDWGHKRIVRNYKNPFVYEQEFPKTPNEGPIALMNQPVYTLKYNAEGYVTYFNIEEGDIDWAKRLWRTIPRENNGALFYNDIFFKMLCTNIINNNVTAYADDKFKKKYEASAIKEKVETPGVSVISYKIKEDKILDRKRFVGEYRIIGICPVVVNKTTGDTTELAWIYFNDIRKYMAAEKVNGKDLPAFVKTFDDLFFYRYFASDIYKESNVFDRQINQYLHDKDEIKKEGERIQMQCIEREIHFWLSYSQ